jgi:hypothetical protein
MPTLHWVGKDKVVNHHHDVPFRLLDKQYTFAANESMPANSSDRDNSNSKDKLKLGKIWESQANQIAHETGYRYHYMMVFESNPIEGALVVGDALKLVGNL